MHGLQQHVPSHISGGPRGLYGSRQCVERNDVGLGSGTFGMGSAYSVRPFTLLFPSVPTPRVFFARLVTSAGMPYRIQYHLVSPSGASWCITIARLWVPFGTPLHSSGNVAAPRHRCTLGAKPPPSDTAGLRRFNDISDAAVVGSFVADVFRIGVGGNGRPCYGSPAWESRVNGREGSPERSQVRDVHEHVGCGARPRRAVRRGTCASLEV